MDLDLSAEHELIRETVRSFAEERVAPVAEELDREHRFPYELVAELAELGLMGIPIPEEHGGAGGDTLAYAIAIEELTRIDSSVAITVAAHTSLGTMPFLLFGSDEQKSRWLPPMSRGGISSTGVGSGAAARASSSVLRKRAASGPSLMLARLPVAMGENLLREVAVGLGGRAVRVVLDHHDILVER